MERKRIKLEKRKDDGRRKVLKIMKEKWKITETNEVKNKKKRRKGKEMNKERKYGCKEKKIWSNECRKEKEIFKPEIES